MALLEGVQANHDGTGEGGAVVELILDQVSQSWSDQERLYGSSGEEVDVALTALARQGTSRETSAVRRAAIDLLCGLRLNASPGTSM